MARARHRTMKAMVLHDGGAPFVREDRPDPTPGPGEAVARVLSCGAGLTIHHVKAGRASANFPIIIGHEVTGEIVKLGPSADRPGPALAVGDPVTVYFYMFDGEDRWTRVDRATISKRFTGYVGRQCDGGYAEYIKLPVENFVRLPDGLDYRAHPAEIGVICDAIATPYKVLRRGRIAPTETVAIFGAGGGLGLHQVLMCKWAHARVIAVDIDAAKLAKCRELGVDMIVDAARDDAVAAITELTGGAGVDVAVDYVTSRLTLEQGVGALGIGGRLLTLGGGNVRRAGPRHADQGTRTARQPLLHAPGGHRFARSGGAWRGLADRHRDLRAGRCRGGARAPRGRRHHRARGAHDRRCLTQLRRLRWTQHRGLRVYLATGASVRERRGCFGHGTGAGVVAMTVNCARFGRRAGSVAAALLAAFAAVMPAGADERTIRAVGTAAPGSHVPPAASAVRDSLPGPVHLLRSGDVDLAQATVTLPLYRGATDDGRAVWYILTDTDDAGNAAALGLNFSPKLAFGAVGQGARTATIDREGGLVFTAGTVDFSPVRTLTPGAAPHPFPPAAFRPGAVGDADYSPLVVVTNAGGHIYNAPIVAFDVAGDDIEACDGQPDHDLVHDKVVAICPSEGTVTLALFPGFSFGHRVRYISTDASDPMAAAMEAATFAPALAAIATGRDDAAFSAVERIFAFANGATGRDNPQRQGFSSLLAGEGPPLNVTGGIPTLGLDYSPLWDLNLAVWTAPAIAAGYRARVTDQRGVLALAEAGHITGPGGAAFGSVGIIVNCPVVFRDD